MRLHSTLEVVETPGIQSDAGQTTNAVFAICLWCFALADCAVLIHQTAIPLSHGDAAVRRINLTSIKPAELPLGTARGCTVFCCRARPIRVSQQVRITDKKRRRFFISPEPHMNRATSLGLAEFKPSATSGGRTSADLKRTTCASLSKLNSPHC